MDIPNQKIYKVTKYYIEKILSLTHEESDFECGQNDEAVGPFHTKWNEAKLGEKPELSVVMAHEAAWQAEVDANAYKALRQKAYMEKWPQHQQNEAITDKLMYNDSTLLDQMKVDFDQIKLDIPKS